MDKPAIVGGTPVRGSMLPYGQQWLDEADYDQVLRTLKSDYITQGPAVLEFEEAVARAAGTRYAVAFSNGTTALHGACFAADVGAGDEVITTPLTFAASSNCVLYQGGTPVFADVEPDTYLLDLKQVREKLTTRTKAVIAVDFAGQPVDMLAFRSFADKHNLVFIQDAAHSLGAYHRGEPVGSVADMTMFSFHPVKPVTTGEGGVIVTNSEVYYKKLLLFRSHGITRDPELLESKEEGPWYYEMHALGNNYRLTDIQAALGKSQMNRLSLLIDERNRIADRYDTELFKLEQDNLVILPRVQQDTRSGWHLYILQLNLDRLCVGRREIFDALRAENIGVNVHYIPVYYMPYYRQLGYEKGLCPIAEHLYERFITLPLFPKMKDSDVRDVIEAVSKVLRYYQKN